MALEQLDLTCPKCGGTMEQDTAHKTLHCPYCGHEVILHQTDPSRKPTRVRKEFCRQTRRRKTPGEGASARAF